MSVPTDRLVNSISYLLPMGMDLTAAIGVVAVVVGTTWAGVELYWSRWQGTVRSPVRLMRR